MKKTKWDFWNIISLLFFTICFLLTIYVTRRAAAVILDSEASSELILAHHLADKGNFYEYRMALFFRAARTQHTADFMPLFRLLDDWSTVRFIGTIILQCLLILSYWYLTRSLKIRSKYFFLQPAFSFFHPAALMLNMFLYHCYYIPHIALGFFC